MMPHSPYRGPRAGALLSCLASLIALSACSTLPNSGPTGRQIVKSVDQNNSGLALKIVDISSANYAALEDADKQAHDQGSLASLASQSRSDLVEPGDKLSIVIYEVGITLFGSTSTVGGGSGSDDSASMGSTPEFKSSQEKMSGVTVDRLGQIVVPYVGRLHVAGETTTAVGEMIERGLKGKSQNPQVLVTIANSVSNAAYVTGDVKSSLRVPLGVAPIRLTDSIVLAGGSTTTASDSVVRVHRSTQTVDERLGSIVPGSADDLVLVPGDHIEVVKAPRTYSVLGASSRVNQLGFDAPTVSLAEAFARAGGPSDNQADPRSVFLFRGAPGSVPAVYRINFMRPESYIIAQRVLIHDKDIIYIANAGANIPAKLVSVVNQLFSPIFTTVAVLRN